MVCACGVTASAKGPRCFCASQNRAGLRSAYSAGQLNGCVYASTPARPDQPWKRVPCLKLASLARRKSRSAMPMRLSVARIDGQVPSPTPTVGTSGDSTSATCRSSPKCSAATTLAVSQPALPPPTTTTFFVGLVWLAIWSTASHLPLA